MRRYNNFQEWQELEDCAGRGQKTRVLLSVAIQTYRMSVTKGAREIRPHSDNPTTVSGIFSWHCRAMVTSACDADP